MELIRLTPPISANVRENTPDFVNAPPKLKLVF